MRLDSQPTAAVISIEQNSFVRRVSITHTVNECSN